MNIRIHTPARPIAALLLASLALPAVAAVPDPQAVRGEAIAQRQCSACHVVAAQQEFPPLLKQGTPSFFDIAKRPGISEKSLSKTISTKHWDLDSTPMTMPDQELSPQEVRAVARYILSLSKQ